VRERPVVPFAVGEAQTRKKPGMFGTLPAVIDRSVPTVDLTQMVENPEMAEYCCRKGMINEIERGVAEENKMSFSGSSREKQDR